MAHIHEKIDFTSSVYIVYENKVLLRMHDKLNIWLPPGGHIELDEDPIEAAIREVKEETGLDVELFDDRDFKSDGDILSPQFLNRHPIGSTHEHIDFVYFAKSKHDSLENIPEHEKTSNIGWFSLEQINNELELIDSVRVYATEALKKLGKKE